MPDVDSRAVRVLQWSDAHEQLSAALNLWRGPAFADVTSSCIQDTKVAHSTTYGWRTANKWAERYRVEGEAGMADRSSRPRRQPGRTATPVVRKIVHLRCQQRSGPVAIADRLGMAASTVRGF